MCCDDSDVLLCHLCHHLCKTIAVIAARNVLRNVLQNTFQPRRRIGLLGGVGAKGFLPLPRPVFSTSEVEFTFETILSFFLLSAAVGFVSLFCFIKNLLSEIFCFLLSVTLNVLSAVIIVREGILDMSFVNGIA